MKYCFLLGNHPDISLVEIVRVLDSLNIAHDITDYSRDVAIISCNTPLSLPDICQRLGGTIKAGHIIESSVTETLAIDLAQHLSGMGNGKITFGISAYTLARDGGKNKAELLTQKGVQHLGLEIKKELKTYGTPVRFVAPQKGCSLSSVTVEKNNLTKDGNAELLLFVGDDHIHIGLTEWVQGFEAYSQRDWERPEKSMDVGMLPPKVAQIMINISGVQPTDTAILLDPFCGLGTVLQEGWLMGFRTLVGSDIAQRNVTATEKNIVWIEKQHPTTNTTTLSLFTSDVRQLATELDRQVDVIVTEPYLGPIVNERTPHGRIISIQKELSQLYIDAFKTFSKILKTGGVVSMVMPVWRIKGAIIDLNIINAITKLGFENITIPPAVHAHIQKRNQRGSLLYSRPGQTVMRELYVWRKK